MGLEYHNPNPNPNPDLNLISVAEESLGGDSSVRNTFGRITLVGGIFLDKLFNQFVAESVWIRLNSHGVLRAFGRVGQEILAEGPLIHMEQAECAQIHMDLLCEFFCPSNSSFCCDTGVMQYQDINAYSSQILKVPFSVPKMVNF